MSVPDEIEARFRARFSEYTHTLGCVHCGLCLPNCPTYGVSGREADSPRGRIYLMRQAAEGAIEVSEEARERLDQCIVCRNCETVCPSGIHMGEMMESFRGLLRHGKLSGGSGRFSLRSFVRDGLTRTALRSILPHRRRIAFLTDLLWLYQRSGLRAAVRAVTANRLPQFAKLDALLPDVAPPGERRLESEAASRGGHFPAEGKARVRVALFLGCITSAWYQRVHRATVRVLQRNGCDVLVPPEQTCCGALHRHAGYLEDAAELFGRNAEAMLDAKPDVLVVNAAGCGAALKEPPHGYPEGLGVKVRDLFELLSEIGIRDPATPVPLKVAHHQPCHLVHAQRVPPVSVEGLLRRIPALELVPLKDADRCCGAGGIYNLLHPEMAEPLQDEKVAAVLQSGAQVVATGNPGCWLQIQAGLRARGANIEVLHPIELLDRAYGHAG